MSPTPELQENQRPEQTAPKKPGRPPVKKEPKETYFRVRFQAKSSTNDTVDVMLAVNGETLVIRREREVIVPQRFLECADHAVYPHFRQLPNQPRKIVGKIKTFPYDRLGESTEEEYLKQKLEGTTATKDAIKKQGYDLTPEDED